MTGYFSSPFPRRRSVGVDVGGVMVGGGAPVVVQSMTNTDTADIDRRSRRWRRCADAGSEIVRITVDRDESAAAVPHIRERLDRLGINVPLVGDFHYIGHKLLADHPACAEALAKYRINPGNVGFKDKKDQQFAAIVEMAIRYDKPVRIGVNWGSLDQELLTRLMDENQKQGSPLTAAQVMREAIVQSALLSAEAAEEIGLPRDKHHPLGQGQRRAGSDRRLHRARPALRPCAASRPDRGRHGLEGHRRLVRRDGHPAAAGHRRHDPHLADAGAERRPHPRGAGGAGTAADHGLPAVRADRRRLPRLRPHHLDRVPGTRPEHPGRSAQEHAGRGARNIPASRS